MSDHIHPASMVTPVGAEASATLARLDAVCFEMSWSEEALRVLLEDGRTRAWLMRSGAAGTVGAALVRVVAGEGELLRLAVRPELRRQGLGARLLREVRTAVAQLCPLGVHLEVRASNVAARRLYTREGFLDRGRRRDYYQAPREDAILMCWVPGTGP